MSRDQVAERQHRAFRGAARLILLEHSRALPSQADAEHAPLLHKLPHSVVLLILQLARPAGFVNVMGP